MVVLVVVGVVAALASIPFLSGGGESEDQDTRPEPAPYTTPIDPSFTVVDQTFADYAASQVQEAADLAELAGRHELPDDLATLAARIHAEQSNQLNYLFAMLGEWDLLQLHRGHPHPTAGGLQPGQLEQLDQLSGDEFAAAWAAAMYSHHVGAIYLAQAEIRQGANPQAREFARAMLENAEIDRTLLEKYVDASSGGPATG